MDYTFTNFVVGSSNQFAHAAALAVANLPTCPYNPLFIYSGTGLGKTHLLRAISHHIRQRDATRRLICVAADRFMSELIRALQGGQVTAFRERYRHLDVLLVDDVQFLAGKERTQEEFFHTFNALAETGSQIVLASDKPPQTLTPLQSRLRSRMSCGLIADIQPPDLETRIAILCKKAEAHGVSLPQSTALRVATDIRSNVRDLEKALVRLITHASLHHQCLDDALADTVLQQVLTEQERTITVPRIQQTVAEFYGLQPSALRSKQRLRSITFPRQVAMFLCRELTHTSFPEIGRFFGGKNHTTVLHSCTKIARLEEADEQVAHQLWQLRQALEKGVWINAKTFSTAPD